MAFNLSAIPNIVRDNHYQLVQGDLPGVALVDLESSANCLRLNTDPHLKKAFMLSLN